MNGGTSYCKGCPATNNSQQEKVGKPRERCGDGVTDDGIMLLVIHALKTEAKYRESWRQCVEGA